MPRLSGRPKWLLSVLAVIAAAFVAGCGGGDGDEPPAPQRDADTQLDRAFENPVPSADVRLDAELAFRGLKSVDTPVRLEASGVYTGAKGGRRPAADIDIDLGAKATGQSIQTGILSVGRRAFVKFGGELYEQPARQVRRGVSPAALGLKPRTWISEPRDRGDDEVAGAATDHISARVDVRRMLGDLSRLAKRSGMRSGGPTGAGLDRFASYFEDPVVDIYVGSRDGVLRRVTVNAQAEVPEVRRSEFNGLETVSLQMTLELSRVGASQRVEPPARSRPLADLSRQLGGLRAIRNGVGEALGGETETTPEPTRTTPEPKPGGSGGDDPAVLRRYSECLDRARPADTDALDRCGDLLR